MNEPSNHILVGVCLDKPEVVAAAAAEFAERFDADLVFVRVDPARYPMDALPDGTVVSLPMDPDVTEQTVEQFDPDLEQSLAQAMSSRSVSWSTRALAGDPAVELARLADDLDAAMIVVGTRRPGITSAAREFFNGSVAAHLAHRQHRPVVVVPQHPVTAGQALPWE